MQHVHVIAAAQPLLPMTIKHLKMTIVVVNASLKHEQRHMPGAAIALVVADITREIAMILQ